MPDGAVGGLEMLRQSQDLVEVVRLVRHQLDVEEASQFDESQAPEH